MDFHSDIYEIVSTIKNIEKEYQMIKGLILTESDLKCHIYLRLMQKMKYKYPSLTRDAGIYANQIHSELSWYDDSGKLTIKPDITILESSGLSIVRGSGNRINLPSKQYEFKGRAIIFELKFIRDKRGITTKIFNQKIMPDYNKIQRLFNRLDMQGMFNQVFCFFVIFNKTNKVCKEFIEFINSNGFSDRHKILYGTGNIDMENINNNYSEEPDVRILNRLGARISFSVAGSRKHT